MALIAKMRAEKIESYGGLIYADSPDAGDPTPGVTREQVTLRAVGSDGDANKEWAKFTPSGSVELTIDNPEAFGQIEPGVEYYVEIRKARK